MCSYVIFARQVLNEVLNPTAYLNSATIWIFHFHLDVIDQMVYQKIVILYRSSYFSKISDDQYLLTVFKLEAKVSDCHAYWLWKWDMPRISVKCQSNKRKTFVNNPMRSEKKYMSVILINMMATKKKFISKKKYAFTWKF